MILTATFHILEKEFIHTILNVIYIDIVNVRNGYRRYREALLYGSTLGLFLIIMVAGIVLLRIFGEYQLVSLEKLFEQYVVSIRSDTRKELQN